jgi:hypothetical protein
MQCNTIQYLVFLILHLFTTLGISDLLEFALCMIASTLNVCLSVCLIQSLHTKSINQSIEINQLKSINQSINQLESINQLKSIEINQSIEIN